MKQLAVLFFALTVIAGCTKNEELAPEVNFKISVSGFNITTDDFGSLKSTQALFDGFSHKYLGGVLNFEAPSGAVYSFDTDATSIEDFVFSLTPGSYSLSGGNIIPSRYGSDAMAYTINAQNFSITESTTSIDVVVTPTCGLILLSDANTLVSSAIIRGVSTPPTWLFYTDGIFYFTYFEPYTGVFAVITKADASMLTMQTSLLQVGYVYQIEVTNASGSIDLNLNPTFTEAELIVW